MSIAELITLHVLPVSHPCLTAEAALKHKGLTYELVNLGMGKHPEEIEKIYGEGKRTVPGMTIGDETVHGSTAILWKLEQLFPENSLYPDGVGEAVREAELWADGDFQDFGRRLPWSALYFRPEAMGTFGGAGALNPAGTDFALKFIRSTWKYHGISAEQMSRDLVELPGMVDRIEGYADQGLIDGGEPTAADFQIGSTVRVLLTVGDLQPVFAGSAAERVARRHFPDYEGLVPAGAFPEGWVKDRSPA
ncbi:MAG: glutathione S-transferase family protein [Solirubrobacterales bacterium]